MTEAPTPSASQAGPFGDPSLGDAGTTTAVVTEPSIVDTLLNLDEFLSGDVRLAEKTARFCTRPDLEADVDALELELQGMVDPITGKPLDQDPALDGGRTAYVVAEEIRTKRFEMAAAMRSVRMRQMDDTTWEAFKDEHRAAFETLEPTPERRAMLNALLLKSAIAPTFTAEQLAALKKRVGSPQIDELIEKAWLANTNSGVSVPKSLLSSTVLKQQAR